MSRAGREVCVIAERRARVPLTQPWIAPQRGKGWRNRGGASSQGRGTPASSTGLARVRCSSGIGIGEGEDPQSPGADRPRTALAILLEPALPLRQAGERRPAGDVVSIEEPPQLTLDGLETDREPASDLGIRVTLGHQDEDLQLPG
jgi:hypothetical protein